MAVKPPKIDWIGSPNFRPQLGITPRFYVVHWMVGNLAGTDSLFQSRDNGVATNYGIEDGVIHQYVAAGQCAYGTGDNYANTYGISVEHAGGWALPGGGRFKPTQATHDSSAHLLAYLADLFGWGELKVGVNVFGHRDFVATECPGTTDLQYIVDKANQIRKGIQGDDTTMKIIRHPNGTLTGIGELAYQHYKSTNEYICDALFAGPYVQCNNDTYAQLVANVELRRQMFYAGMPKSSVGGGSNVDIDAIAAKVEANLQDDFAKLSKQIDAINTEIGVPTAAEIAAATTDLFSSRLKS